MFVDTEKLFFDMLNKGIKNGVASLEAKKDDNLTPDEKAVIILNRIQASLFEYFKFEEDEQE